MFKWLVDIDVRKVMAVVGFMTAIEMGFISGQVSFDHLMPASWIPYALAYCKVLAFAGGLLTGAHGVAALMSPRMDVPAAVAKAIALFAILLLSSLFVMPAMAQSSRVNGVPGLKPILLPKPAPATTSAPASSGDPLAEFMAQLEKVTQDNIEGIIADVQAADADAGTIITPAIPASGTQAAIDAVVKDPIAHACYPAIVRFLQSIPAVAAPTGKFVGVQLFQAKRDFVAQLQAGLPVYLKLGCAPLLGDEINIAVQTLALVGVRVAPAALTALMPALAPVTLPAMVLTP